MRHSVLLCASVLLLAVAGCGPSGGGTGPEGTPGASSRPSKPSTPSKTPPTLRPTPSASGPTDLTIVIDDGGTRQTWQLTCDPAGGDHPRAEEACAALNRSGASALPPVPADRQCAQVYGGPQTATIRGTWRGQEINSSLSRKNACEMARWDALEGLLPGGDT